jgi:phage shock protein A
MPILTRLTRLFRADLHAMLDRIEEPELLLRQSLREMEDAVADGARQLATQRQQHAALARRQLEIAAGLAAIPAELALCLDAGNDALARVLLRRRLEGERLLGHLQRQTSALDASIQSRQDEIDNQREQFERLRQQAEVHAPAPSAADAGGAWSAEQYAVSDADVELALLRERRRTA